MSTDGLPTDTRQWPHGTATGYNARKCRCEACRSWMRQQQRDRRRKRGDRTKAQQIADAKNAALANTLALLANLEDPRHGQAAGYSRGCRCDQCRAGLAARMRRSKQAASDRPTPEHVHGTTTGYSYWNCRCDRCRNANSTSSRQQRLQRQQASA